MSDEKHIAIVRLDCLRLAHWVGRPASEVVADAEQYLNFISPPAELYKKSDEEIPF